MLAALVACGLTTCNDLKHKNCCCHETWPHNMAKLFRVKNPKYHNQGWCHDTQAFLAYDDSWLPTSPLPLSLALLPEQPYMVLFF